MTDKPVAELDTEREKRKYKSLSTTIGDLPVETKEQRASLIFPHIVRGKPLATIENLRALFGMRAIYCRYNVISKRILFDIPGESFSAENGDEVALALLYSYIKQEEMPIDGYKGYTLRIADENQYNPALEMIRSKPWDKIDRMQSFYDTIQSPETEAKELLMRRWLITCVCMALHDGVDSAGCLVLQGATDLGKTWWVKKLVPEAMRKELVRTDASVDPKDKDSVSQVISYWIVELGEIEATFNRADLQGIKTFITRDSDTMRRPYGEGDKRYPRRTALVASVDQTIYLRDTAGNRRFWTIPCTAINSYHTIDMQQLWAQVLWLVEQGGESWQLLPDEKEHIRRINEEHMQIEPIIEMIRETYDIGGLPSIVQTWKSATAIAQELGIKTVTQRETRIINQFLQKAGTPMRLYHQNKQFRL